MLNMCKEVIIVFFFKKKEEEKEEKETLMNKYQIEFLWGIPVYLLQFKLFFRLNQFQTKKLLFLKS